MVLPPNPETPIETDEGSLCSLAMKSLPVLIDDSLKTPSAISSFSSRTSGDVSRKLSAILPMILLVRGAPFPPGLFTTETLCSTIRFVCQIFCRSRAVRSNPLPGSVPTDDPASTATDMSSTRRGTTHRQRNRRRDDAHPPAAIGSISPGI
jgi:hypothetical protein